jgi:hypothetical protein
MVAGFVEALPVGRDQEPGECDGLRVDGCSYRRITRPDTPVWAVEGRHPLAEVLVVLALLVPSSADVIGDSEQVCGGVPAEPADQAQVALMGAKYLWLVAKAGLIFLGERGYPSAVPQAYHVFWPFPAAHRPADATGERAQSAGGTVVTVPPDQRLHRGLAGGGVKVGDGIAQYLRWDAGDDGQAVGGHGRAAAPVRGDVTAEGLGVQPVGVSEPCHVGGAGLAGVRFDLPREWPQDGGRDAGHDQAAPSRLDCAA